MRDLIVVGSMLLTAAVFFSGCNSGEQPAAVESTAVVFNAAGAPTVEFSVPDMMCEHSCALEVRKILAAQPGVKDVKVELDSKTATVAVDKDKFDADAAVAALVDVQFKNTTLKSPVSSRNAKDSGGKPPAEAAPAETPEQS